MICIPSHVAGPKPAPCEERNTVSDDGSDTVFLLFIYVAVPGQGHHKMKDIPEIFIEDVLKIHFAPPLSPKRRTERKSVTLFNYFYIKFFAAAYCEAVFVAVNELHICNE